MNSTNNLDLSPSKLKLDSENLKQCLKEKFNNFSNDTADSRRKSDIEQLINELKAVSLEWKLSRNMSECKCGTTFDAFNKKVQDFFEQLL